MALGVLLVAGCGLASVMLLGGGTQRVPVLVAARDIPAGATVHIEDLTTAELESATGLSVIPSSERQEVVGRVAALTVPAGSPLNQAVLADTVELEPEAAVVAVLVGSGQLPIPDVRVGDPVQAVRTSTASAGDGGGDVLAVGTVFALHPLDDGSGATAVSVLVPVEDAPAVADAAGADRVRLVLVSRRGGSTGTAAGNVDGAPAPEGGDG